MSSEMIPFFDFGGDGPLIHFAHANGYPPACYQQLIRPLLSHHRVVGTCHRPLWPGSRPEEFSDWQLIAGDMIRFFDQQGLKDMVGMGHSLGAVATMYAAQLRPDLFTRLVLIEPVFLPRLVLRMVAANPAIMEEFPLVKKTQNRRYAWPNRPAAFAHFRKKTVFRRWSDAALTDYVEHGLVERDGGEVVLMYPREWEVRFYTHPPMDVWDRIPSISHPTLAVRGAESDTLSAESWQLWQELQPAATFVELQEAGHMLVMERPIPLAEHILFYLETKKTT